MAPTSGSTRPSNQNREKRVLPSRSRRGGPGIGNCDVDVMILETRKRQCENEPLIPAATPFLLTTDASLFAHANESGAPLGVNIKANLRYFEQPEVLKAYKEQLDIQTPEFVILSEDASVGGRFRPREPEDQEADDTFDAVYEKRHRKYEAFEKRLRLREKEKLKHEQYKLKERIEQLRAMDSAAFLVLPPSSFSPPFSPPDESSQANGAQSQNEGERRRQEMLEVASMLEEKYKTLLPNDRKTGSERDRPSVGASDSAEHLESEGGESELDEIEEEEDGEPLNRKPQERLKLKIKLPRGVLPGKSAWKKSTKGRTASLLSARKSQNASSPLRDDHGEGADGTIDDADHSARKRRKQATAHDDETIFPSPARPTIDSNGKTTCLLLQSAMRSASAPRARKAQRNVTAFGTKLPAELEEFRHFELPWWIKRTRNGIFDDEDVDGEEGGLASASLHHELAQNA